MSAKQKAFDNLMTNGFPTHRKGNEDWKYTDVNKILQKEYKLVEKIINKGSDRATRCVEIAGGSPLTEKEINATKKSEINTECPSIANPNYESY